MIQRFVALVCMLALSVCAIAQMPRAVDPVHVKTSFEKVGDDVAVLSFQLNIDNKWHVYATDPGEGPIPTTLNIETSIGVELDGQLTADREPKSTYDNAFMSDLRFFEEGVIFHQTLKLTGDYHIEGYLEYGACNDMSCLPPTAVNFKYEGSVAVAKPVDVPADVVKDSESAIADSTSTTEVVSNSMADELDETSGAISTAVENAASSSLWMVFWLSFLGGFGALLTPCVWPIIPMTVSFFLKRTKDKAKGIRDSIVYGISIVIIYLLLGLLITVIAGPSALNAMSTNAVFNLIFTAMLIVFGLSFIGAFEITLPSSWSNAVDQKAEQTTGFVSIFLMAFTLALVSFSCTGPIIGFLLVEVSTQGSFVGPAIGMLGFSLALALPFTLFAMFPSWMQKLPKSGSWMATVKVVLGFIELAFALKFFSVADLAYGWHWLDREVFICIWASLAFVLGMFLLGKIKMAHVDTDEEVGTVRVVGAICSFAFCLYLIPGLWGAPLKAVSAFCPPITTQDFVVVDNTPHAQYTDYDQGMAAAKLQGKPVLLDFTGHGCVNCRKMEQSVWSDKRVAKILQNDYVLISLYVDDKTPLAEKIVIDDNTILRTVGDKWSYLQRTKYGVNAQPYYAPVDADGNLKTSPYGFDANVDHFIKFLEAGKK